MAEENDTRLPIFVVALGGNAILRARDSGTIEEQFAHASETMGAVADLAEQGFRVAVTHGNGPVVGNIVMRNEAARGLIPPMPLYIAGADSEGGVGFMLQQVLFNELTRRGLRRNVVTLVTQTVVDATDPAFADPTKPIGPYFDAKTAERLSFEEGWTFAEESRGWRRVVASPLPLRIVEVPSVLELLTSSTIVIAAGGGGIPVLEAADGTLSGVDAVVDKDWAGALLAVDIGADAFAILMEADGVYRDWGKPGAKRIESMTAAEARKLIGEGAFSKGSVAPKIGAAAYFAQTAGKDAIICASDSLGAAIEGKGGTRVTAL